MHCGLFLGWERKVFFLKYVSLLLKGSLGKLEWKRKLSNLSSQVSEFIASQVVSTDALTSCVQHFATARLHGMFSLWLLITSFGSGPVLETEN